jgi:hypothetical protein
MRRGNPRYESMISLHVTVELVEIGLLLLGGPSVFLIVSYWGVAVLDAARGDSGADSSRSNC